MSTSENNTNNSKDIVVTTTKGYVGEVWGNLKIVRRISLKAPKKQVILYVKCNCGNPNEFKTRLSILNGEVGYLGSCGCKDNDPEYIERNKQGWFVKAFNDAKNRDSRKDRGEIGIEISDIAELYESTDGHCSKTGKKFRFYSVKEKADDQPSLDRIDSSKGYTKGNIQITCWEYNRKKGDSTDAQHEQHCLDVLSTKGYQIVHPRFKSLSLPPLKPLQAQLKLNFLTRIKLTWAELIDTFRFHQTRYGYA